MSKTANHQELRAGADWRLPYEVTRDGVALPLAGLTVRWAIGRADQLGRLSGAALIERTLEDEEIELGDADGELDVIVPRAATAALSEGLHLSWVEVVDGEGRRTYPIVETVTVLPLLP